jgi:hypothetical protein
VGALALAAFAGSVVNFAVAVGLRKLRVPDKAAAHRAGLSAARRRKRIQIGSWLAFAVGAWLLGAAVFFELVELRQ